MIETGGGKNIGPQINSRLGGVDSLERPGKAPGSEALGPSFTETLKGLQNPAVEKAITPPAAKPSALPSAVAPAAVAAAASAVKPENLKFSNHAVERMMARGISFSPQDMERLNGAVARAQAKGSKDSLILMNDSALIVSVKNKTVVTVMDKNALKENVFTNIDSTIVM
jgi:flagellar operon protein